MRDVPRLNDDPIWLHRLLDLDQSILYEADHGAAPGVSQIRKSTHMQPFKISDTLAI